MQIISALKMLGLDIKEQDLEQVGELVKRLNGLPEKLEEINQRLAHIEKEMFAPFDVPEDECDEPQEIGKPFLGYVNDDGSEENANARQ